MIRYQIPDTWMKYEPTAILNELLEAKVVVLALESTPYQRDWVEELQRVELKREVAGTSRIEGADFTESELDEAMRETPELLETRSQRQAHAAAQTYRWIDSLPRDHPLDAELVFEIHRKIVTGADDDHCEPGKLRPKDVNVHFGRPRHRGAGGGEECRKAFHGFVDALAHEFPAHDPLIQALAAHYHLAAMHPFTDGNGRAARALEALLLRRGGLQNVCCIPVSNFYYEEKHRYLASLSKAREEGHDMTAFLKFALEGVAAQGRRVLKAIQHNVSKAIYRNLMYDLFNRLKTPKRRMMGERQIQILKVLLEEERLELVELVPRILGFYADIKNVPLAVGRDLRRLRTLGAIDYTTDESGKDHYSVRLDWPKQISESNFLETLKALPKAKSHPFLG